MLINKGRAWQKIADQFGYEFIFRRIDPMSDIAHPVKNSSQDFASVSESVSITLQASLEISREASDYTLINIEIDVFALRGDLEHRH